MKEMYERLGVREDIIEMVKQAEIVLQPQLKKIDALADYQSLKVLNAFHKYQVSEIHMRSTTGYGYDDIGRDTIEKVFAEVLGAEDCLVRNQFISGSHALTVCFFALLRPGDTLLSISGEPYDTLHQVIGIAENPSSLASYDIQYEQIDLVNDAFDIPRIQERLKESKVKVIEIQRSKGYSSRKSIGMEQIKEVIRKIREVDSDVIIMVDNCYCEFVNEIEPTQVGADIMVGSLIKNLGGGIAPNGAYIAGRKDLVELAAERLTVPGEGKEVGPSLGVNKSLLQGLFFAPTVVASSLKIAILASYLLEQLGYTVEPRYCDSRADIVQMITFGTPDDLIHYCQGIQMGSFIDAHSIPIPGDMPGYEDQIIMASGSFTQGSSIELSCDGPIRPPYIAYMQGALTYPAGKLGVMKATSYLLENR